MRQASPPPKTARTFNGQRGFGLRVSSPAFVHASVFGLHLQYLQLCRMLLPLDFVLLGGLNGCVVLEPLHNLWRRPEVAGQDDWMALQSCLVLHLPSDLYVVICKAGLGKKKGSIWRRGKILIYIISCRLISCLSFTTVLWIARVMLQVSVAELTCFEAKPTWSIRNTSFYKIKLYINYQMHGPVLVLCLLNCSLIKVFNASKSKLKTKQGLQDVIGDIYYGDSRR